MIWIVGEYAERIDNADELLNSFLDNFTEENTQVQLQLLTAIVKLFLKRPTGTQELVQKVLGLSTQVSALALPLWCCLSVFCCFCFVFPFPRVWVHVNASLLRAQVRLSLSRAVWRAMGVRTPADGHFRLFGRAGLQLALLASSVGRVPRWRRSAAGDWPVLAL